ncbi:MAG TPA: Glu-tRNA(Gln) amidotransferase subunit GatD [Candidatus Methanomethylophilaceae archaeon]|nr:Glu-tRNA(Gln) amidotransferase subunit GatD [Candidatus Methanomethylophilaceae archaeon]
MSYSESLSKLLASVGANEGCKISVKTKGCTHTGILMPHNDLSAPDILVLKLGSGYNIGIRIQSDSIVELLEVPSKIKVEPDVIPPKKGLKKLVLIGTGGTIASYVDYKTGGVKPALSTSELVNAVPELRDIANIEARVLFSIFSENMNIKHWQELASVVEEEINKGADGIIIPHGTDTMGYTSAALSFMLDKVSKPVVLVGAQRSSDRPSTDAIGNLTACAKFCVNGDRAGVFVLMHDTLGGDSFAVHCGTRVRKMHTSRRDSFRSINAPVVAHMDIDGKIKFTNDGRHVSDTKVKAKTEMEKRCVLLQYFPGMEPKIFEDIILKSKGVVIAGSGLGHVNEDMIPLLKKACDAGTIVVITSQCLGGTTNLNVYNNGREMVNVGVIPVGDMLPETAYVKLMWVLANSKNKDEAVKMMKSPLAGDTGKRRLE